MTSNDRILDDKAILILDDIMIQVNHCPAHSRDQSGLLIMYSANVPCKKFGPGSLLPALTAHLFCWSSVWVYHHLSQYRLSIVRHGSWLIRILFSRLCHVESKDSTSLRSASTTFKVGGGRVGIGAMKGTVQTFCIGASSTSRLSKENNKPAYLAVIILRLAPGASLLPQQGSLHGMVNQPPPILQHSWGEWTDCYS